MQHAAGTILASPSLLLYACAGRTLQGYSAALGSALGSGRRLLSVDNSGTIVADTRQSGTNIALGSRNVNQANSNQNAQAAGNEASASNSAAVYQSNGTIVQVAAPALHKLIRSKG